ncbi:MAG: bifunctional 2-C-methyl-D-erythritol 4-phosphate cytidylyltransferase/2-C-methyl-D-erythritol 2,4-cyclodiphosphate synthase [Magnetococcales bacterium]|nr:bifunctional 2-C-methyl-D-erythritol 4-phosphate cytidylyltransferase/2-C-methyl-D-erythritol 2,4-cyclodiphosphate synthase [Magnetococcales bacterium]
MPPSIPTPPDDPALEPVTLIVVAAGRGSRFGGERPKQYLPLEGRPLLAHTLERLHAHPLIRAILPVIAPDGGPLWQTMLAEFLPRWPKLLTPVAGGQERQESVLNALESLDLADQAWVGIHDGARPFPGRELLDRLFAARRHAEGVVPAIVIHDTIKRIDDFEHIVETLDRAPLRRIQTPQLFRFAPLLRRHREARQQGIQATDDASLMEGTPTPILTIPGDERNIKITRPEDWQQARHILEWRRVPMETRIGQGFDVHRFTPDRPLMLGGVAIPHDQGLLGHSDADVLLHAIMDALLGAAALRDIGHHFPDHDPAYRGADSRELLRRVRESIAERGFRVVNVDATVICEAPRLAAHIPGMIATIAAILNVEPERINIKATTTERLGFTGRREGIAAQAVALLAREEPIRDA